MSFFRGVATSVALAVAAMAAGSSVVATEALAKKPPLILREDEGGPLAPTGPIDAFVIERQGSEKACSQGWGLEEGDLKANSKSKDKIKVRFELQCDEAFGETGFMTGRITGLELTSSGEVTLKGKIFAPIGCTGRCEELEGTAGRMCNYEAKKFTAIVSLPGYVGAEVYGIGKLNAKKSAAACAPDEEMVLLVTVFGPKKNGTQSEPFFSLYAEVG